MDCFLYGKDKQQRVAFYSDIIHALPIILEKIISPRHYNIRNSPSVFFPEADRNDVDGKTEHAHEPGCQNDLRERGCLPLHDDNDLGRAAIAPQFISHQPSRNLIHLGCLLASVRGPAIIGKLDVMSIKLDLMSSSMLSGGEIATTPCGRSRHSKLARKIFKMIQFLHFLRGDYACECARPDGIPTRVTKCRDNPGTIPSSFVRDSAWPHSTSRDNLEVGMRKNAGACVRLSGPSSSLLSRAFSAKFPAGIAVFVSTAVFAIDAIAGGSVLNQYLDSGVMIGTGLGAGAATMGVIGVGAGMAGRVNHGVIAPSVMAVGGGGVMAGASQITGQIIGGGGGATIDLASGFSFLDGISVLIAALIA